EQLRPGALPEEVWQAAQAAVPERWQEGFMNGGKFLGHSIGLTMDEPPVLARSSRAPLEPGMTFAVEPKIALPGVGLVGTENTYLVQENGPARCLTGSPLPLTCL
ncbi:MAG: M24 family metallopeptidase, partial [Butyricicoccus sp.]